MIDINPEEILFIDIETVPVLSSFKKLSPQWQKLWEEKMRNLVSETVTAADLYEKAGIYAEFGRIIVISAGYFFQKGGEYFYRVKSFSDSDEKQLLADFVNALERFAQAGKKRLCAHNGQEFDYPYIARRILVHGLKLPRILNVAGAKPWETKEYLIDTLQLWKFGDYKHYTSLSLLCSLFGILTPKDDIDGSMVAKVYYEENDLDRIVRYCEKDTLAVANLFLRY
ncbi:MAG: 3'-5' exonuclease, partial [Prolixibacteraceae bacterium]|nr:3'-5' exonuclease [Prolixibacteraceae bacterium]